MSSNMISSRILPTPHLYGLAEEGLLLNSNNSKEILIDSNKIVTTNHNSSKESNLCAPFYEGSFET